MFNDHEKVISMMKVLISRTDAIGDVILTLPMVGLLKKEISQDVEIYFLGRSYTKEIISCAQDVDHFLNYDDWREKSDSECIENIVQYNFDVVIHVFPNKRISRICKKAKIKLRVGTRGRLYHWLYCNKLVSFSRKRSNLHEAELNLKLIQPLIDEQICIKVDNLYRYYNFSLEKIQQDSTELSTSFQSIKDQLETSSLKKIILHPKSHGSAREWGLEKFSQLIDELKNDGRFEIVLTGTEVESELMKEFRKKHRDHIIDTSGLLSLRELILLIGLCDGIVAASTGPLHIASAMSKFALGLYIMTRPMHPGRWKPIGLRADYIVYNEENLSLDTLEKIPARKVYERIKRFFDSN